jgi:hypothetical protein
VTWRRWAALSESLGGGDVALLGAFVSVVGGGVVGGSELASLDGFVGVVWAGDMASSSGGGVDEPAPDWPKCGQSPGRSMAAGAAAHGGGGRW